MAGALTSVWFDDPLKDPDGPLIPVEVFLDRLILCLSSDDVDIIRLPHPVYISLRRFESLLGEEGRKDSDALADHRNLWRIFAGLLPVGTILGIIRDEKRTDLVKDVFSAYTISPAISFIERFLDSRSNEAPDTDSSVVYAYTIRPPDRMSLDTFRALVAEEVDREQGRRIESVRPLLPTSSIPVIADRIWVACAALAWRANPDDHTLAKVLNERGPVTMSTDSVSLYAADVSTAAGSILAEHLHSQVRMSLEAREVVPAQRGIVPDDDAPWETGATRGASVPFWATPASVTDFLTRIAALHLIERMNSDPRIARCRTLAQFGRWLLRETMATIDSYLKNTQSGQTKPFVQLPVPIFLDALAEFRSPTPTRSIAVAALPGAAGADDGKGATGMDTEPSLNDQRNVMIDCVSIALVWFTQFVSWVSQTPDERFDEGDRIWAPFGLGSTLGLARSEFDRLSQEEKRRRWLGVIVKKAVEDLDGESKSMILDRSFAETVTALPWGVGKMIAPFPYSPPPSPLDPSIRLKCRTAMRAFPLDN